MQGERMGVHSNLKNMLLQMREFDQEKVQQINEYACYYHREGAKEIA